MPVSVTEAGKMQVHFPGKRITSKGPMPSKGHQARRCKARRTLECLHKGLRRPVLRQPRVLRTRHRCRLKNRNQCSRLLRRRRSIAVHSRIAVESRKSCRNSIISLPETFELSKPVAGRRNTVKLKLCAKKRRLKIALKATYEI